jgi:hypothetical protein
MLAKTVLVVFLIVSRDDVLIQYTVKFDTESQCQAEAQKQASKTRWESYPLHRSQCVFDITAKKGG